MHLQRTGPSRILCYACVQNRNRFFLNLVFPCLQWGGEQCNLLQFQPVSFPQGYGMTPNVTSWGGNIVPDPVDGRFHLFVAEMVNKCPLQVSCAFVKTKAR